MSRQEFVDEFGGVFERSPWIAERAAEYRPFASANAIFDAMCNIVDRATEEQKLSLIRSHPDLVGRAASAAQSLTPESIGEQSSAGLFCLTAGEIDAFMDYNQQYWNRFGFPFIICARENKKEAILAAFPVRLAHSPAREIQTALGEIRKIARLRLMDKIVDC